jgi:hypothetical protein
MEDIYKNKYKIGAELLLINILAVFQRCGLKWIILPIIILDAFW